MADPIPAFLQSSIQERRMQVAEDAMKRTKLPTEDLEAEVNPWLAMTGWADHLAGLDARTLHEAIRTPTHTETKLVLMSKAVDTLLDQYQKAAQATLSYPAIIRRLVHSSSLNEAEINLGKPTLCVTPKTFKEYTEIWTRLMAHLLRTYQLSDTNRMVLSTRQKELVAVLDGNLANGSTERIIDGVLQLSLSVLEQHLPRSRFESPLLHFLAIMALDPVDLVWIDASEYVSVLIGVIHIGKIIILNHGYLTHPDRDATNFGTYCREHLEEGSLSAIRTVKELLRTTQTVADSPTAHIECDWIPVLNSFQYQDKVISLASIRILVKDLLEETRQTLCRKLVFQQPSEYLASRSPALFEDEMRCRKNGFSFVEVTSNKLHNGAERVLGWLCHDDTYKTMMNQSSPPLLFSTDMIRKYTRDVQAFLYKLALLCYIGAGYPPPEVDFLGMKINNTWGSMRSIYLDEGRVCMITRPTEAAQLEVRHLPDSLGRLMLAYMVDVLPFVRYLNRLLSPDKLAEMSGQVKFASSLVWATPDTRTLEEELNLMLTDLCRGTVGAPIGLGEWRILASSIDRYLLNHGFEMAGVDVPRRFRQPSQAKDGVSRLPQTIRPDLLMTLTTIHMNVWRDVSTDWQQELGLVEATTPRQSCNRPRVPPKPSALSSSVLPSVTKTTTTTSTSRKRARRATSPQLDDAENFGEPSSSLSWADFDAAMIEEFVPKRAHTPTIVTPIPEPANPEAGRELLCTIFDSFANGSRCAVCRLARGSSEANHSFASCERNTVTVETVKVFVRDDLRLKENCHFACAAPKFVCGRLWGGGCKYVNILLPALIYAFSSSKYKALIQAKFPNESMTSMKEMGAVASKPAVLYGESVTNAIVLFELIMRTTWSVEERFQR